MRMQNDPFASNLLERLPEPRKVVLLRASRIGDFLCAAPALRALRRRLPFAEISMITLPLLREFAQRLPSLDKVWSFPGFPGIAEQLFDARAAVSLFEEIQRERFDLAIQMQGTGLYSNPFVLLLGACATAGFVRPGDPAGLLDAALPYPHHLHEIHCVLALTRFLGAPSVGTQLEFPLTREERAQALALLTRYPQPWIGLHPSSREPARRWPLDRYVALAAHLLERQNGTLFFLGDAEAEDAGQFLAHHLRERCLDLTGKLSLMMLGALIERLSLLVTNDSGPAHIAYALGAPTITLFENNARKRTNGPLQPGPFRLIPPPASANESSASENIEQITVPQVLDAAEALLREGA